MVPPEAKEEELRLIQRALDQDSVTFNALRTRKDGTRIQLGVSMRSVFDASGKLKYISVGKKDALRLVEGRFRGFLDASPDAVVIANDRGTIVLVNSQTEKLFGYTRAELVGQAVEILSPERLRGRHPGHRDAYFLRPKSRSINSGLDLCGLRKDGTEFPAEISLSPIDTEDGTLVSSTIRDISERKAIESALKLANSELEAFSYSVAHDLRAPLRAMNGFSQILLDDYKGKLDPRGVDSLEEIQKNAVRMGALIDALLLLSKVARSGVNLERVDLTALARAIGAALQAADPNRSVEFIVEEGLTARLDPQLARTLMENLLGNSWKFTGNVPLARIEFGAVENRGEENFFVRDNGAGFDMEDADRMFSPFQRLHTAGEFPGTGIGLATTQRIVHRHGGRIRAEGEVGRGATFYFTVGSAHFGSPV
jgi:PAS domain S-box-containing protein